ncbi:MAG: hypothetical protein QOG54_1163 [Actinomycetota bacterium]|jgi:hypothetical protein|nr:hypothetical protein [Actinomycetota bacterium]
MSKKRQQSQTVEIVLADIEWVASSLPDPLEVIDRCTDTILLHWAELNESERRSLVAEAHERFAIALDLDQGKSVVAA